MLHRILISFLFVFVLPLTNNGESGYFKEFFQSGKPKSEGWLVDGKKTGYW